MNRRLRRDLLGRAAFLAVIAALAVGRDTASDDRAAEGETTSSAAESAPSITTAYS